MNLNIHKNIDEHYFLQRFQAGDRDALGHIFRHYFSELYSYGLKIIANPDLVKDQIQDLFVHFWEERQRLGEIRNLKVYLLVSLKNNLLRAIKRQRNDESEDNHELFVISAEDFIIEQEDGHVLSRQVAECIERLSSRQREVIFLRFYHNLDFLQLADVMGMNVQSVRNLLFRGLEKIRQEIGDSDIHQSDKIEFILFQLFARIKQCDDNQL